ncbi:MAG: VWA domain-containing protein [Planctomycetota bacterium]
MTGSAATYPLRRPTAPPRDSGAPWFGLPLLLSLLFHVLLLGSIHGLGLFEILPPAPPDEAVRTIEVSTVERAPAPPESESSPPLARAISLFEKAPAIRPERFPEKRDAGPRHERPDRKPLTRYPEEELPIIARAGLSERTRLLVRDGERDAVDPGRGHVGYEPSERRVESTPPVRVDAAPRLRDEAGSLAKLIRADKPRFGATGREPGTVLKPGRTTPQIDPPRVEPGADLSPQAERLFADEKLPVDAKPLPLDVEIDVYAEPKGTDRFFRLTITENEKLKLPVLRKNVLFVVDISASVRRHMLRAVQAAIRRGAGAGFHQGDRFNVVRFSEMSFETFDRFVPATAENIRRAAKTIRKEPAQVRTDVYTALTSVVRDLPREGKDARRPAHIYLITDGNVTTGVQDIRHIVNDLEKATRPNHSIFAFIPGADTGNRYLLDLLAYRNRGVFAHAKSPDAVGGKLTGLLRRFRSPILMNLGAKYGSLRQDEVYPARLPNLYRGEPIVIHGRCRPGDTIAVGIVGNSAGGLRQFVYSRKLPEVLADDPSIARGWARGKIHHLAARIATRGDRAEYRAEIDRLSRRYNLASPFK